MWCHCVLDWESKAIEAARHGMSAAYRRYVMAVLAASALLANATPTSAQVVRVRLLDVETHQPLAGVLVVAMNAAGAVEPAVLSSGDGIASVHVTGSAPLRLLIDGQQQYPPGDPGVVSIDKIINANDVMAIEVYARGGNMPISLQVNDTKCGVIAFWTGSRR